MIKVITYGTFDMLHYGHRRLLERAKALGDYLIVGVTAEDFDMNRGKVNVHQSLMERIAGVRATGIADEIIVEEYEGQKIDDIQRYNVDIFTLGSDWVGKYDYLNEYCQVIYLPRTEGISSSDIREEEDHLSIGVIGGVGIVEEKFIREGSFVTGVSFTGLCFSKDNVSEGDKVTISERAQAAKMFKDAHLSGDDSNYLLTYDKEEILDVSDAIYITASAAEHYEITKLALQKDKHVIVEAPLTFSVKEADELFRLAKEKGLILTEAIKTAYSLAFNRMLLLLKGGVIGDVVSVDATITSLNSNISIPESDLPLNGSLFGWGPAAILAVHRILGTGYKKKHILSAYGGNHFDLFTKIDFEYENAVASIKVGKGVKSEGELVVTGTKGYIYVPAPWWKTDYFEVRYEDPNDNRRFFYTLKGEGIRNMIVAFVRDIKYPEQTNSKISPAMTLAEARLMEDYLSDTDLTKLNFPAGKL